MTGNESIKQYVDVRPAKDLKISLEQIEWPARCNLTIHQLEHPGRIGPNVKSAEPAQFAGLK